MKIVSFNTENLFLFNEDSKLYKGADLPYPKPENKLQGLKKTILDLNPDILCLTEIGGEESLLNFNQNYLDSNYTPFFIEGNSDRGIELAYLVRSNLNGFHFEHISHKERSINFNYEYEKIQNKIQEKNNKPLKFPEHKFSRDVSELRVFKENKEAPALIILLCHLKSRLDKEGVDPLGKERRASELKTLVDIYLELNAKFKQRVPIILTGDFNGEAGRENPEPEFQYIYDKTSLLELFEILEIPQEEKTTFHYFRYGDKRIDLHLDYFFVSENLKDHIETKESGIYLFEDPLGKFTCPPNKKSQAETLPSDHYPIYLTLKNI